jgi:hypothetical protein
VSAAWGKEMVVQRLAKQGKDEAQEPLLDKETGPHEVVHPIPLKWLVHSWPLGRSFYDSAKFGIVQYVSPMIVSEFHISHFNAVIINKAGKRLECDAKWLEVL